MKYRKPFGGQRKLRGFHLKYTQPFIDPQNMWGLHIKYTEPSADRRNLGGFRIEYTELSKFSYLVCRTLWHFTRNIQNSGRFSIQYTEPYVFSETILDFEQCWRNFHVVLSKENELTFLTLRNLKTLLGNTTERFSFHETENSSVEKWRTLKVR